MILLGHWECKGRCYVPRTITGLHLEIYINWIHVNIIEHNHPAHTLVKVAGNTWVIGMADVYICLILLYPKANGLKKKKKKLNGGLSVKMAA